MTAALYAVVSSPAGQRDWEGIRHLYHPDARLVRTGVDERGSVFASVMSFDEYVADVEVKLADVSFSELEVAHDATIVGNVAQVASVYRFTLESPAEQREGRGVNFLTFEFDGNLWRIMSIVWDNERSGVSLPGRLLEQEKG